MAVLLPSEKRPTGTGWIELDVIERKLGLSRQNVSAKMNQLANDGKMQRFEGNKLKDGKLVRCVWFRTKPNPAQNRS